MSQGLSFIYFFSISLALHAIVLGGISEFGTQPADIDFFNDVTSTTILLSSSNVPANLTKETTSHSQSVLNKKLQQPKWLERKILEADTEKNTEVPGQGRHPLSKARLLLAPKPPYPYLARKQGFEGKATFDVTIASSGKVKELSLIKGSGCNECDQSAYDTILHKWHFKPASRAGKAIKSKETVVIAYKLDDR